MLLEIALPFHGAIEPEAVKFWRTSEIILASSLCFPIWGNSILANVRLAGGADRPSHPSGFTQWKLTSHSGNEGEDQAPSTPGPTVCREWLLGLLRERKEQWRSWVRGSYQPGPEVAHIASTYISSGNTQSLDHLNFRLARKCSLTVDSKGRGNLAVTLSRSCDFLEPCPPVYERQAEKRSQSSVSGPEHLLLSSPPLYLLLHAMVAFVIQVLHCSKFHVSLTFAFWTMKRQIEEEEGEGVGREEGGGEDKKKETVAVCYPDERAPERRDCNY